ncbi:MAG: carbamoyltransferase HypF [Pirellulales bacterium]
MNGTAETDKPEIGTLRLVLQGRVQGVGLRPAVYRLATRHQLTGRIGNSDRGVELLVQGPTSVIETFAAELPGALPRHARLTSLHREWVADAELWPDFAIQLSEPGSVLHTEVAPDRRTCDACRREVDDPGDRRYGYPFATCEACGPRYSTVTGLPYERCRTTFAGFVPCERCRTEYSSPADRRFHAQTVACADCGPAVWAERPHGAEVSRGAAAVKQAVEVVRAGGIVAMRGLGGYQLIARACDSEAVSRLRARKQRHRKPLAVMVSSVQQAREVAHLNQAEADELESDANPIVLVRARSDSRLDRSVHPGLDRVGIMLTTTPLHDWLVRRSGEPLICTSGNIEGNPLEVDVVSASRALAHVADLLLHHDREIVHGVDDSVVQVTPYGVQTIRLGRGMAPLPLEFPGEPLGPCLAMGGHMKGAIAWSSGTQAALGPHIGDLDNLATRQRWLSHLDDMLRLYRFRPERWVHDLHPGYFTSQWSEDRPGERVAVQHHHAHVVSGMLEHQWLDREVLGISCDGTGYGPDGTIWGGEAMVATRNDFRRIARVRQFGLPGGEWAIREPWRIASLMLSELPGSPTLSGLGLRAMTLDDEDRLRVVRGSATFWPQTSSLGRLFDVASVLATGLARVDFDGQAAMELEATATPFANVGSAYDFPLVWNERAQLDELDWRPLLIEMVEDVRRGESPGLMAVKFHLAVATGLSSIVAAQPSLPVMLSGGVFQNQLLLNQLGSQLDDLGRHWKANHVIPPGDGGLAAGQLATVLLELAH